MNLRSWIPAFVPFNNDHSWYVPALMRIMSWYAGMTMSEDLGSYGFLEVNRRRGKLESEFDSDSVG